MAKGEGRGWKSFVPSVRGVIKILIVLVVLKVVLSYVGPQLPTSVQKFAPTF